MYPKLFFENFWRGDQKNELFVCMPFHDKLDEKFGLIKRVARILSFENATRVKENWTADDIKYKIFDGIANSKTLLFDLSDDPKSPCEFSKQVNSNVIYELGVANAIRDPEDMLMIRGKTTDIAKVIPFDISSLTINEYEKELTEEWLKEKLAKTLENQKWYKGRRVEAAAKSIDSFGLKLIHLIYKNRPSDRDHFNDETIPKEWRTEAKLAILRMMDLGIVWFATGKEGTEYAYHWTPFGREVIKRLGIEKSKN